MLYCIDFFIKSFFRGKLERKKGTVVHDGDGVHGDGDVVHGDVVPGVVPGVVHHHLKFPTMFPTI